MKAILIGSAAWTPREKWGDECGDVDVVCDEEWKDAWAKIHGPGEPREKYGNAWKYDLCSGAGGIHEVIVPHEGSAHRELLEMAYDPEECWDQVELEGGLVARRTPLSLLAAMYKASAILPAASPEKWARRIRHYEQIKMLIKCHATNPLSRDAREILRDSPILPGAWEATNEARRLFKSHRKECLARQKKPPKLNQTKDKFFGIEAYEVFEHDDIHRAIAYPLTPAYEGMKDGEVWCSRAKWDLLPKAERLRCVVEEAAILALERSVIPHLFLGRGYRGARWAFEHALFKVSTTITSGWFREYCLEHHAQAKIHPLADEFVDRFFEGVKRGEVRCKRPEVLSG